MVSIPKTSSITEEVLIIIMFIIVIIGMIWAFILGCSKDKDKNKDKNKNHNKICGLNHNCQKWHKISKEIKARGRKLNPINDLLATN